MTTGLEAKHRSTRKRGLLVIYLMLVAAGGLIIALSFTSREPVYRGRGITAWLSNYPDYKQKDWREAEAALQAFGTNAIPYVMREFTRRDPVWRAVHFRVWYYGPLWLKKLVGVPRTWRFDTRYAPEVFAAIGPSSIPLLTDSLSSTNPTVQIAAARGLGWFGTRAKSALPKLKERLAQAGKNRLVVEAISNSIVEIVRVTEPGLK
jgi:hypothetical protein